MEIPRYQNQQSVNSGSNYAEGMSQDFTVPNKTAAIGHTVGNKIGEVGQSVGEKIQRVQDFTALNEVSTGGREIVATIEMNAERDSRKDNIGDYNKQILDARSKLISSVPAHLQQQFAADFDGYAGVARVNIQKSYWGKEVTSGKVTLYNGLESLGRSYQGAVNPVDKQNFILRKNQLISDAAKVGFIKADEADKLMEDSEKSWETTSIINAAEVDPVLATKMLEESKLFDDDEKRGLQKELSSAAKASQDKFELETIKMQGQGQSEIMKVLNDPEALYIDKKNAIQDAVRDGRISKSTEDTANLMLESSAEMSDTTHTADLSEAVLLADSLNGAITETQARKDPKKSKEYLLKVQATKDAILKMQAAKRLSADDVKTLIAKIDKDTLDEQRDTLVSMSKDSGGGGLFGYKTTYSEAKKFFDKNVGNKTFVDSAMRDYFHSTEGKKVSEADKKAMLSSIVKTYNDKILGGTVVTAEQNALAVGTVNNGWKFKGGDRYDKNNWEKV